MCSRYCLLSSPDRVKALFAFRNEHVFPPRYNIAPTQPVAIVRLDHAGVRELALVRWGLIPSWTRDPSQLSTLFNARAEGVNERPSFRGAMRHRRCLVPADGYYDWIGPAGQRRPVLVRPVGGGPLAFAALWEHWLGADGSEIETMAIVTVAAQGRLAQMLPRRPAIVSARSFEDWLATRQVSAAAAAELLTDRHEDSLEVFEIDQTINNPRHDSPEAVNIIAKLSE